MNHFDYKDWILNRAEELCELRYPNQHYDDLPDSIQMELWQQAEADYISNESARIDALYDAAREAKLLADNGG